MVKCCCRFDIEDLFKKAEAAFKTLAIFAPKEKAEELGAHIANLSERMEVHMIVICEDTRIDSRSDRQIQIHFFGIRC